MMLPPPWFEHMFRYEIGITSYGSHRIVSQGDDSEYTPFPFSCTW